MKTISIIIPCYNEEVNVEEVYTQIKQIFKKLPEYNYEYIFIDNSSTDNTLPILRNLAQLDKKVKIIVNSRNFGSLKSPYYGFLQGMGDAVVVLCADLQDPPELIVDFVKKWEEGYKIVFGVREKNEEFFLMELIRKVFYRFIKKVANIELIENFSGHGLFDRQIMDIFREINDPYPYIRGLMCEVGFEKAIVKYTRRARKKGVSGHSLYMLYDYAMTGITNYSKIPIRIATFLGFLSSVFCLIAAFIYIICKIIFWTSFSFDLMAVIIGLFLFLSVQLFFTGLLGEYILTIYPHIIKRPLVIEKERINF
jgi:glycosyltransferase involved in cell wall biosynthesis